MFLRSSKTSFLSVGSELPKEKKLHEQTLLSLTSGYRELLGGGIDNCTVLIRVNIDHQLELLKDTYEMNKSMI